MNCSIIDISVKQAVDTKWQVWSRQLNNIHDNVLICCEIQKSIQIQFVQQIIKLLKANSLTHCIIVFEKSISPPSKKQSVDSTFELEFLQNSLLCCDIFEHDYQPQMQLCNKTQAVQAASNYQHQMAKFSLSDPVIVWMNWKPNSIVAVCEAKCKNELDVYGRCCSETRWRQIDNR